MTDIKGLGDRADLDLVHRLRQEAEDITAESGIYNDTLVWEAADRIEALLAEVLELRRKALRATIKAVEVR